MSKVPARWRLIVAVLTAVLAYSTMTIGTVIARPPDAREKPDSITTASDGAKHKLHPRLQAAVEAGSTNFSPKLASFTATSWRCCAGQSSNHFRLRCG